MFLIVIDRVRETLGKYPMAPELPITYGEGVRYRETAVAVPDVTRARREPELGRSSELQ